MITQKHNCLAILFFIVGFTIFSSCTNLGDIPFPEKELSYLQPFTVPLQFGTTKKLRWDTTKIGGINSVIKKLDIEALPSTPYDPTGFRPFNQLPTEVEFDFNSLPETNFDPAGLPSKTLQFKTSILPSPLRIKTLAPTTQKNKPISFFDFGQIHGLQAKFITCLLKDKNGLLWVGSQQGIFRYDGEYVQKFVTPSPSQSFVSGIAQDNNGNIWFIFYGGLGMIDPRKGTISYSDKIGAVKNNIAKMTKDEKGFIWVYNGTDKAVSIINPATNTFKNIDKKMGLSDSTVFEILEDDNKNIWVTTYNGGVNIINLTTGKIKYLKKASGLFSDTLTAITKDKNGQVWIATYNGKLNAVNIKSGTVKHYNHLQEIRKRYVFTLFIDDKERIWMGTSQGIELIDPEKNRIRLIDTDISNNGNQVVSFIQDDAKRIWVGTLDGLHVIDQYGETVRQLGSSNIISMMEDTAGNLWVGSAKGVEIIDAKRKLSRVINKSNGLSDNFVQSFLKVNGNMMVTTDAGFNIIDPINKTIEKFSKKEGLTNDTVYAALKDNRGNTWIVGYSNGIDQIDAAKKIIRHTNIENGLSDDNILDIKKDRDGLIWLATANKGVDVVDPIAGTIKNLSNQPGLKDTCNRILMPDKYGRMWIGTDKGIYVADTKEGTLTSITTNEGLVNNQILALLEYNGSVIAGTKNKINIITAPTPANQTAIKNTDDKKWKINLLSKSEDVTKQTNSWSADCVTKNGEYIVGDAGITIINEIKADADSAITYITGINVMTQPEHFVNKKALDEKDTLWAADTFYTKEKVPVNTGYASAKKISWDSVSGIYNLPVNLILPYNQNYIHFQFVQANLSRQDTTWFVYILEGIDKKWSTLTSNTFTENYLNLAPGKYIFKVSSKNKSGKWTVPASFSFTISPPWYATWWAYTFFALLGIALLRAYIVYRGRKLQKENKLLEEKVTLRTKQLQKSIDDLKTTQTQLVQSEKMASLGELTAGIAHEIQNPLNFINNFSEVNTELIEEMKNELKTGNTEAAIAIADDITANEQKINHHGKRADSIVKGMLQHSRSSNGIKEPTDINVLADEYLRLAYHGLRAKDKSFNALMKTDFDETIGKINIVPQDMGRVILNLITNAFYAASLPSEGGFSDPNIKKQPTVTVSTSKNPPPVGAGREAEVLISVSDNGPGIPKNILDKIFQPFFTTKPTGQGTGLGLSMSYDIVTKGHGGQLTVKTIEGEGSQFIIILPT